MCPRNTKFTKIATQTHFQKKRKINQGLPPAEKIKSKQSRNKTHNFKIQKFQIQIQFPIYILPEFDSNWIQNQIKIEIRAQIPREIQFQIQIQTQIPNSDQKYIKN